MKTVRINKKLQISKKFLVFCCVVLMLTVLGALGYLLFENYSADKLKEEIQNGLIIDNGDLSLSQQSGLTSILLNRVVLGTASSTVSIGDDTYHFGNREIRLEGINVYDVERNWGNDGGYIIRSVIKDGEEIKNFDIILTAEKYNLVTSQISQEYQDMIVETQEISSENFGNLVDKTIYIQIIEITEDSTLSVDSLMKICSDEINLSMPCPVCDSYCYYSQLYDKEDFRTTNILDQMDEGLSSDVDLEITDGNFIVKLIGYSI